MEDDYSTTFVGNTSATTQAPTPLDYGWLLVAAVEFYINYAVIGIGIIGTGANALVLYALIVHNARETKKRMVNWLIINQNLIDLCCCFTIVISFSVRVSRIYLTGGFGYIVCVIFINETAAICLLNSSVINLLTITIERYLKIVYPFWSKRNLKSWMISAAIVFSWIAGILCVAPVGFLSAVVVEGSCLMAEFYWENTEISVGLRVWNFVSFFLIPLFTFVYCYGHILVVMRKQARVMAGHNVQGSAQSATQAQNRRIKWKIIKTMIIVSAFFIVCWFPVNFYFLVVEKMDTSELVIGYLVILCLPYINISLNPFIYSTKHEGIRRILARMIICRRRDDVAAVADTAVGSRNTTGRTGMQTTKHK